MSLTQSSTKKNENNQTFPRFVIKLKFYSTFFMACGHICPVFFRVFEGLFFVVLAQWQLWNWNVQRDNKRDFYANVACNSWPIKRGKICENLKWIEQIFMQIILNKKKWNDLTKKTEKSKGWAKMFGEIKLWIEIIFRQPYFVNP